MRGTRFLGKCCAKSVGTGEAALMVEQEGKASEGREAALEQALRAGTGWF